MIDTQPNRALEPTRLLSVVTYWLPHRFMDHIRQYPASRSEFGLLIRRFLPNEQQPKFLHPTQSPNPTQRSTHTFFPFALLFLIQLWPFRVSPQSLCIPARRRIRRDAGW